MNVKPGYKQTEIGIVPQDWRSPTIDEISIKVGSGVTPRGGSARYKTSGRPFIRSQNVGWGVLLLDELVHIDEVTHQECPATELRDDDVLLNITGASIGRSACVNERLAGGNVNQHVCIIRLAPEAASAAKLVNLNLLARIGQRQIDSFQAGGNREGLNFRQVRSIVIPLPANKAEQEAIAEALSDADTLIESLEQLIAKKRQIKQGAMQQLLTGRKRLPGFTDQFQETTLEKQAHIKTGDKNNEDKNKNGAYPFFVRSAYVERIDSYSHDCEAILVPGEGNIGDIFHYVNGRFDVHQRVYAITGFRSSISAKFLYYYLSKYFGAWAMQNTVKATVDSLRLPTFLDFELTLPPTNEEQTVIAETLSDMDAEISELETRLAKARQVKQGMMQQLLTGRIRLVKPQAQPIAQADAAAI